MDAGDSSLIIKDAVSKEIELAHIINAMIVYLQAIRDQRFTSATERSVALEEVRKAIPQAFRCLNYLRTKEIEGGSK